METELENVSSKNSLIKTYIRLELIELCHKIYFETCFKRSENIKLLFKFGSFKYTPYYLSLSHEFCLYVIHFLFYYQNVTDRRQK